MNLISKLAHVDTLGVLFVQFSGLEGPQITALQRVKLKMNFEAAKSDITYPKIIPRLSDGLMTGSLLINNLYSLLSYITELLTLSIELR